MVWVQFIVRYAVSAFSHRCLSGSFNTVKLNNNKLFWKSKRVWLQHTLPPTLERETWPTRRFSSSLHEFKIRKCPTGISSFSHCYCTSVAQEQRWAAAIPSPRTVFVMKFNYNNSTQEPYKGNSWAAVSTPSKFLIAMNSFEIAKHCSKQNTLCVQMFPLSLMNALRQDSPRNNSGFDWNLVGRFGNMLNNQTVPFPELADIFCCLSVFSG